MKDVKKVLLPTDFSEGSDAAAAWALDLAARYKARLVVLHVVYDFIRGSGMDLPQMDSDLLYGQMEEAARASIAKFVAERLEGYADVEAVVIRGIPNEDILRFAGEQGIGLIVMGTHGRRGLDRIIFGSTAQKVVREALCPVLTVAAPHPA